MRCLTPKAQELLALLTEVAKTVIIERGWSCHTTLVTLFIPQRAVALALDVDTSTIRRWFYRYPQLREQVATAPHYCTISAKDGSRNVVDGMLWTVRMNEGVGEFRVPIEALQHQYRNLDFDIHAGATLREPLEQRKTQRAQARVEGLHASPTTGLESFQDKVKFFLGWVFGDRSQPTPVGRDACMSLDEAVNAVEDGADASVLARVVTRLLRDRHSFRYWVRQVRAWHVRGRLWALKDAVQRVLVDEREGFARRSSALLVSRLDARTSQADETACETAAASGEPVTRIGGMSGGLERPPSMSWLADALERALGASLGGGRGIGAAA